MKNTKLLMLFAMAGFSLLRVQSARAANYIVNMYYYGPSGFYYYSPATLTVAKGDTVTWTNTPYEFSYNYTHTTTSGASPPTPSGLWDSGTLNNGQTYTLDTSSISAGTYPYFCKFDYDTSPAMLGTLIITNPASATPPTVGITSPAPGAVFAAPARVTIQATPVNGSGTVTNVQFLVGARVLANVTAAPFSATTNNLAAGAYNLSVIAEDNNGLLATNSTTISVVTPVGIAISAAVFSSQNHFRFSYSANTGLTYVVQASTNLLNWNSLVTKTATTSPVIFTNPNAIGSDAFYRVGRLPNP